MTKSPSVTHKLLAWAPLKGDAASTTSTASARAEPPPNRYMPKVSKNTSGTADGDGGAAAATLAAEGNVDAKAGEDGGAGWRG